MSEEIITQENQIILDKRNIAEKIYTIRGVQVMLDSDLASIYNIETKYLTRQVKRNIERFPNRFRFQLTKEEYYEILRCQNVTLELEQGKYSKYLPYVFTEQGVYQISSVIKSDIAAKVSVLIMDAFVEMRHYLIENQHLLTNNDYLRLSLQVNENKKDIQDIKEDMVTKDYFNEVMNEFIGPNRKEEYLFLNGEKFSADIAYNQIYKTAKDSIYIIDNYIGLKTLLHLKDIDSSINVIIFSDNIRNGVTFTEYNDFVNQYNINITFKTTNKKVHDRYIVLDYNTPDETIYHCGASSKDAGNRITSITKINDNTIYKSMIHDLLNNSALILK